MSESRVPQNPIVIIIFPIETAKCWGFPIFLGHRTPLFNMCIPELSITIHWNPSNMLINYIILYDNSLHPHYISIVSLRWLVLSSLLVDSPLNHHEHIWFVYIGLSPEVGLSPLYRHYITIISPLLPKSQGFLRQEWSWCDQHPKDLQDDRGQAPGIQKTLAFPMLSAFFFHWSFGKTLGSIRVSRHNYPSLYI